MVASGCLHEVAPLGFTRSEHARMAINNAGTVAGTTAEGTSGPAHSFVQVAGGPVQVLDDQPFGTSTVAAINQDGVVVGELGITSDREGNRSGHPFSWTAQTGVQDLGLPPRTVGARAVDVNDHGIVLVEGYVGFNHGGGAPFLFDPATKTWTPLALPIGGPIGTNAAALNNGGEVVGTAQLRGGEGQQAVYWDAGSHAIHELDDGGAAYSSATDLNDSGVVVGRVVDQAACWSGLSGPPRLFGAAASVAAVNEQGLFVGSRRNSAENRPTAVLWDPAKDAAVELGDYGRGSSNAQDVNDVGVAVGVAYGADQFGGDPEAVPQVVRWDPYEG
jgi:hypothetical protein